MIHKTYGKAMHVSPGDDPASVLAKLLVTGPDVENALRDAVSVTPKVCRVVLQIVDDDQQAFLLPDSLGVLNG